MTDKSKSLFERAADAINTSWKYSWYWDVEYGNLTQQGLASAIADGEKELDRATHRIASLLEILQELKTLRGEPGPSQTHDPMAAVVTFAAYLTRLKDPIVAGESHDASRMAELVETFRKHNGLKHPDMKTNIYSFEVEQ